MRVLLVEDDAQLGDGIRAGLKLDDYSVDWVRDGEAARLALPVHAYDACVLDLGLPKRDGLSVLTGAARAGQSAAGADPHRARQRRRQDRRAGRGGRRLPDQALRPARAAGSAARPDPPRRRCGGADARARWRGARAGEQAGDPGRAAGRLSALEYALLHDLLRHKQHFRTRSQIEESLYAWGEEAGATPSRCTFTAYARNSAPTSSAPSAAWATGWVTAPDGVTCRRRPACNRCAGGYCAPSCSPRC